MGHVLGHSEHRKSQWGLASRRSSLLSSIRASPASRFLQFSALANLSDSNRALLNQESYVDPTSFIPADPPTHPTRLVDTLGHTYNFYNIRTMLSMQSSASRGAKSTGGTAR